MLGVEAEPDHFRWMEVHFRENHLEPARCLVLNAGASARSGDCWFYVGKPASWYGQCIVPDTAWNGARNHVDSTEELDLNGEKVRRVRSINVDDLLRDLPLVDYLHMDIQGAEYDFLAANPERLRTQVKLANIGTHSPQIEAQCRAFV